MAATRTKMETFALGVRHLYPCTHLAAAIAFTVDTTKWMRKGLFVGSSGLTPLTYNVMVFGILIGVAWFFATLFDLKQFESGAQRSRTYHGRAVFALYGLLVSIVCFGIVLVIWWYRSWNYWKGGDVHGATFWLAATLSHTTIRATEAAVKVSYYQIVLGGTANADAEKQPVCEKTPLLHSRM